MNLASILSCHATSWPEKPAIEFDNKTISYRDLWQLINSYASYLTDHGVARGDRIGLILKEHPDHLILHYALARLGAVILPIDHRWTRHEKNAVAESFNAKLVIIEPDDDRLEHIMSLPFQDDWSGDINQLSNLPESEHMPLLISLSSGTTGKPKGAIVSHEQMYERFVSQWVTIGFNATDRFIGLTPLFFGAGRSFCMCFLAAGATVIIDPPPHKPEQLVETINASYSTVAFLVPTMLRGLLPLASSDQLLLPHLKRLIISGAALYPDEAQLIRQKINPSLTGYYASSEGGGISVLNADEFIDNSHTVGRPTFRTEVEIVDETDKVLASGETGRLRYRGPAVAGSFINSRGIEDTGHENGWFYPGDLATILDSGHIILKGRDKDVINRGGVNIYPAEIESILMQHPEIMETAVVGVPSEKMGEEIIAYVVLRNAVSNEQLDEHCRKLLASYKIPVSFNRLNELPKKASGKINKSSLATPDP